MDKTIIITLLFSIFMQKKVSNIDIDNKIKQYNGINPYIKRVKRKLLNNQHITDTERKYSISNYDRVPYLVNKVYEINEWEASRLKEQFNLSFIPKRIKIGYVLSETDKAYHLMVKFTQKQQCADEIFLPKKFLYGVLTQYDWNDMYFDLSIVNNMLSKRNIKLKDYQEDGVKFLCANNKCIMGDDMGLGKTIQSISATIVGKCEKILVICPASLKSNWLREIGLFYDNPLDVATVCEGSNWNSGKKYTIVNYDILCNFYKLPMVPIMEKVYNEQLGCYESRPKTKKVRKPNGEYAYEVQMRKSTKKELIEQCLKDSIMLHESFDTIIIDEIHRLSNKTSQTFRIIEDFIKKSQPKRVWGISGTFLTNNPQNLYNVMSIIRPDIFSDYEYYMRRYCGAKKCTKKDTGRTFWMMGEKCENLDELAKKIEHVYIRRTKEDLNMLPEKKIFEKYYSLNPDDIEEYNNLWLEYRNEHIDEFENVDDNRTIVEGGLCRRFLAEKTLPYTVKEVNIHIEQGCKVIIATCYDFEVDYLLNAFGDSAVVYNGKMTSKQKDEAQRNFMTNPLKKVFIGNIVSAGVGLTLTSANIVVLNSFSWRDDENNQFIDRVYRIGQKKDVEVYFQFFENTYIEDMWKKVLRKRYIQEAVIKTENNKKQ